MVGARVVHGLLGVAEGQETHRAEDVGRHLAHDVDGVVLVIQAFQTKKKTSLEALKHLERANVLGFLMNQVEESPFSGRNRAAFRPA